MFKKTIPFTLLIAVLISFVETATSQTRFGARAGMNLSGLRLVDEQGDKQERGLIPRFQIGLTFDVPVGSEFYIQPAALYSGKGFKQDGGWLAGSDSEFRATASTNASAVSDASANVSR